MGLNCDRKSQLSEILTEPLNPRGVELVLWKKTIIEQNKYLFTEYNDQGRQLSYILCISFYKKIHMNKIWWIFIRVCKNQDLRLLSDLNSEK